MPATHSNARYRAARGPSLFFGACGLRRHAGGCGGRGRAGDANATGEHGAPSGGASEEIVVTATRREESISKVPISITALTQDALDQKGIRDFTEMVRFTPGRQHRHLRHQRHLDPRHLLLGRRRHHRHLHRRHADPDARARLQPRRHAAQDLRSGPRRGAARTAGHAVRRRLRGRHGALHHDAAERHHRSTYARTRVCLHASTAQPSYEAGIAHGGPIIDGVLGFRASFWYRYDGGWINRVDDTTGAITDKNANHANTDRRALGAAVPAGGRRENHAELHVPEQAAARSRNLLAGVFESRRRAVQQRDARAHSDSRRVLPAGAQDPGRLRAR